jgi:hypothetical protein
MAEPDCALSPSSAVAAGQAARPSPTARPAITAAGGVSDRSFTRMRAVYRRTSHRKDHAVQHAATAVVTAVPVGAASSWPPSRDDQIVSPRHSTICDDIVLIDVVAGNGQYGLEIMQCYPLLGMDRCLFAFSGLPHAGSLAPVWDAERSEIVFGGWTIALSFNSSAQPSRTADT